MKYILFVLAVSTSMYLYCGEAPQLKVLVPQKQIIIGINPDDIERVVLQSFITHTIFFHETYKAFMKNGDSIVCSYGSGSPVIASKYWKEENDSYPMALSVAEYNLIRSLANRGN